MKTNTSLSLGVKTKTYAVQICEKQEISLSALVNLLLKNYIRQNLEWLQTDEMKDFELSNSYTKENSHARNIT